MCAQPAQKRDEFITQQLTNHLFQTSKLQWGMDLAALNIQRGRDHGLAPYNSWREACGLQPFTSWVQMLKVMSPETQRKFKKIYRDIDDIDLFPGAMAEKPVTGGLVGPTFACILAQQFSNLRRGDRFWYENGGLESSFTPAQLQQLRKITLARILCDNLDSIDTIQPFVFLTADNDRNQYMPCEKVPNFDLSPWTEHRIVNDYEHNHHEDHHNHENHYSDVTSTNYPPYHNHHGQHNPSSGHHTHHNYDKYTTSHPHYEHSSSHHHPPHYHKPSQPPSYDHYHKPPIDDYQKPILLPPEEDQHSHYGEISTPKPSYKPKPQNNYTFTYVYEFDIDHKPTPAPTPTYSKPKPSINPTPSYTVIHVHHTVEHHSPSDSDSYHSSHHTKPHYHSPSHSKPHHEDSYFPDHSHGDSGDSYHSPSDSYLLSKPTDTYGHTEKPVDKPYYPTEHRPPSVDNYGPDLTVPYVNNKPGTDSYRPVKPIVQQYGPPKPATDSYKPPDILTYRPPSSSYGLPPSYNQRPTKPSGYGHTKPSTYRPQNTPVGSYGLPKPTTDKYGRPKPPSQNYGIPDTLQTELSKPGYPYPHKPDETNVPPEVDYPKPEIIYTDTKPSYHHTNANTHHNIKPIGSGTSSYTVIEVSDHSKPHDNEDVIHSKPSSIVTSFYEDHSHQSYHPTSHGHHEGYSNAGHSKPTVHHSLSPSKQKPPSNSENHERPIIIYTSAAESHRLKGSNDVRKPSVSGETTLQAIDPDRLPQLKPHNVKPSHSPHFTPNEDFTKYTTLDTSPELPIPGLGADARNAAQTERKHKSEEWTFDAKEVADVEEIPDVPYLPSDPESVRELPRPIAETEDEYFEEDEEDEELSSRSL